MIGQSGIPALAIGLLLAAPAAHAQHDAPVRYDGDHLSAAFHASRRAAVLAELPANAVAVFVSAPSRNRQNDVSFEYRQSSDLYYLTGTHEPNSVLILAPDGIEWDGRVVREVLLVPDRDPSREVWLGRRFGAERAGQVLGFEAVGTTDQFAMLMEPLLAERRLFHLPFPSGVDEGSELDSQIELLKERGNVLELGNLSRFVGFMLGIESDRALESAQAQLERIGRETYERQGLGAMFDAFTDAATVSDWRAWVASEMGSRADGWTLDGLLSELRAIKTDEELAVMQRAIDITAESHREAARSIEPGMREYEVEALIEYVFKRNGAEYTGFPSIVGSGENSVILHYETNRRRMQAGDMVVIDIGAEYHGYSADITRTYPVSGRFSSEQRQIYELVLRAQEAGIAAARADSAFLAPHRAAQAVLLEGMRELGLVEDARGLRRFFMHGTSHYLGLDVHDAGTRGPLQPGTVITVEPGIYIAAAEDIDPRWWNIGVRIEDDILITDGDPVNLSAGAPRDPTAIERLMAETGLGNDSRGVVGR